ncbi:hypothetical protein SO694_0017305 [Aureococcus anophagefferens]|uniref:C2 domain-containing protein n=1 Tax=Aureococcus anophagefferens TaxID=44056 RepID=A0ABR1FHC2_AURAN
MVENGMNGHKKSSPTREVTVVVASVSGLKTALAGSDRRVFVRVRSAAESKWQRTACAPRSAAAWDEVFAVNHVHRGQLFVEVVEEGRKKASFSAVAPLEAQGRFQLPLAPGVALTCTVRRGSPLTSFAETEALIVALSGRLERADADRKRRFFAWVRTRRDTDAELRRERRARSEAEDALSSAVSARDGRSEERERLLRDQHEAAIAAATAIAASAIRYHEDLARETAAAHAAELRETVQALERKRADAVRELEETYAGVVRDRDEAYGKQVVLLRERRCEGHAAELAALRDGHDSALSAAAEMMELEKQRQCDAALADAARQRDRSFTEEKEALEAALRDGHGRDREALERQHGEHLEKLRSRTRELEEAAADAERRHADGLAEVERHHVSERRRELAARDDAHTDALESSEAALATRHRAAMDEQAESHRALYEAQATTHRAALDAQASSHQVAMETLASSPVFARRCLGRLGTIPRRSSHKAAFEKQVANHKQLMDDHAATHEETSRVRDSVRDDSYGKQLGQMRESHAVAVEAMRRGHDQRPVVTTFFPEQQLVGHDEALKTEKQMTVDAKDREHGAAVLHALRERDEAHAAERQALEDVIASRHAQELAARSASHEEELAAVARRHEDALQASHAEKDRAHDERLAAALGSMRDDHDAALGSMRDDHDAARAEYTNARARRVVGRWLHRLLSEGWNKWRTSVRVATVAEMREQHAREIAALRNAARAEDANARARRVVGRWLHRLLSEGWNKWRTSAREATHAAALAEAARLRDGQTASLREQHDAALAAAAEAPRWKGSARAREPRRAQRAEHAEAAARAAAFDDERSTLEEELVTTLVERHAKELEKRNAEHAILVANCERSARAELDCRRGCEEDLRVKHKEALADQAKKHAAALQERDNEYVTQLQALRETHAAAVSAMRENHAASLGSTREMARLEKDHEHRSLVTNALRERDDTHGAERRALEDALAADHARDLAARSAAHDAAFGTLAAQHDARLAEHAAQQALHLQQALEAARRERDLDNDEKLAVALRDRDEAHEIEKDELDLFLMCKSERELDARSSAYDRELASKDEQFRALEAELRADREHFASQLAELEARHTAEMEERMAELEESHFEAMNEAVCSVAADKDRERDISLSSRTQTLTERHREELELAAERHDATMASVALAELMLFYE